MDTALAEELTCVYNIMNKILNMCLDVLEFEIQNKQKMFRENCFENLVSDWWKNEICVHKTTFRKKCKNKKKPKNHESVHNLWQIMGTKLIFLWISENLYEKQFSARKFSFVFYSTI